MGRIKQTKSQVETKIRKILSEEGYTSYNNLKKLTHLIAEYWGGITAMQKALGITPTKRGRPQDGRGADTTEESPDVIQACLCCQRPSCIGICAKIKALGG